MEFKMFHEQENIVGKRVWICDYRFNDVLDKAIRHVPPTEVEVLSNDDLPKGKTVYYSKVHFRPIGKKGQPLKKIIAPFDTTGFRAYTGVAVHVFENKEDCVDFYVDQCKKIEDEIEREKKVVERTFQSKKEDVHENIQKALSLK